jgi:hypothetical protein
VVLEVLLFSLLLPLLVVVAVVDQGITTMGLDLMALVAGQGEEEVEHIMGLLVLVALVTLLPLLLLVVMALLLRLDRVIMAGMDFKASQEEQVVAGVVLAVLALLVQEHHRLVELVEQEQQAL